MPLKLCSNSIVESGGAIVNTLSMRNIVTPLRSGGALVYGDNYTVLAKFSTAEINAIAADMPGRPTAQQEYGLMVNSDTGTLTQIEPDGTIVAYTPAGGLAYFGGYSVSTAGTQLFAAGAPVIKVTLAGGGLWSPNPLSGFTLSNLNTTITSATGGAYPQSVGFYMTFSSDTAGVAVQYIMYKNGAPLAGAEAVKSTTTAGAANTPYSTAAARIIPVANGDVFELWTLVTGNVANATITTAVGSGVTIGGA
jgi:hypothetical protein